MPLKTEMFSGKLDPHEVVRSYPERSVSQDDLWEAKHMTHKSEGRGCECIRKGQSVEFTWLKGHSGNLLNECDDMFTSRG
jgi:ribonuclease HI